MGRARAAAALTLACACVHPRLEPASIDAGQAPIGALPDEFVLLSWNTFKQRRRGFATELRRFSASAELVLLQEAVDADPAWSLLPSERAWTLVIAFEYGCAEVATGVATGSTAAPIREQAVLSPMAEPLTRTPKSSLLTWIPLGETELLLVNLHGINFRRAAALAAQLRTLDAPLFEHTGPLVVAGDFNTWTENRREVVEDFALRHGLASAFSLTAVLEQPRLDDVYVRGLIVREAEVLSSRSSDHDGLRVELALP